MGEQITSYPDASSLSLKRPFDRCPAGAIACISSARFAAQLQNSIITGALRSGQTEGRTSGITEHPDLLFCAHAWLVCVCCACRLRPHGCRGYLVGWDVEKPVWWGAFRSILQQQPQECGLLMTEAPFNLPSIQASTMQVRQALPDACVFADLAGIPKRQLAPYCVPHRQYGASCAC